MGQKIGRSGKNGTGGNPTFLMRQNVYFNGSFQLNLDVLGSDSLPSLRDSLSEQSVQHCVTLDASHATQPTNLPSTTQQNVDRWSPAFLDPSTILPTTEWHFRP